MRYNLFWINPIPPCPASTITPTLFLLFILSPILEYEKRFFWFLKLVKLFYIINCFASYDHLFFVSYIIEKGDNYDNYR